ncbi:glycosyltransferase [Microbacterium enclense]|uniref:glycosyltransferase n=1 Tax=Microbacterium enclense TaxID=993073 RepID=UPI0021A95AC3|nr:glycosyltransferase [Microbacterium enclense]MCT2085759.1 glycosyltransferase [Microbacterium enclense]
MNSKHLGPLTVVFADHSDEPGGAEFALIRLLSVPQRWSPVVVLPSSANSGSGVFVTGLPSGIPVIRNGPGHTARREDGSGLAANLRLAAKIVRSAVAIARLRVVREADVLVANTTRAGVYVALAALIGRKPFVVHIRDLISAEAIGPAATLLMRRVVLPRAAGIIANSRASRETVSASTRTQNVRVIPSPAGLAPVEPDSVDATGPVRRIGMVARIDPWKGQELLLRAFADACIDGDQVLVFHGAPAFGHEQFAADLRRIAAELSIQNRVQFAGHTSDVSGAISALDVCVQASVRAEPLGQNVLQYLSAGKPTIVSGEGGPTEWVTHRENGLVFLPRDQASLADAIREIVGDSELRHSLARNAAATPGLLTDSQVSDQIFDVVRTAAGR